MNKQMLQKHVILKVNMCDIQYSNTLVILLGEFNLAVPDQCPRSDPIEECPTCCCTSTDNVEFYDPDATEPECTAPPATYEMRFVFWWSPTCHPDYYFDNSIWSPPTGVSHSAGYRMWDACQDAASEGVGLVSRTGNTSVIRQEYLQAGERILDNAQGDLVPDGSGVTSRNLTVDHYHPYVSAISMLVPSPDRMVGVADLRLCDGAQWKETVQVCFELFSTATASDRVAPEMERNSVQANNCSFGYVRFTLLETQVCVTEMRMCILQLIQCRILRLF